MPVATSHGTIRLPLPSRAGSARSTAAAAAAMAPSGRSLGFQPSGRLGSTTQHATVAANTASAARPANPSRGNACLRSCDSRTCPQGSIHAITAMHTGTASSATGRPTLSHERNVTSTPSARR